MKAPTMLDTIRSLLGTPACAIPLSFCHPARSYLLERAGIPPEGTAILFAVPYVMTADVRDPARNVSLYAVPRDYHGYMKELSDTLLPVLRETYADRRFALFADHAPIAEVDAAARAGLGLLGLNGLLITPEYGSFVFLGEIVTDGDFAAVTGHSPDDIPETPPRCRGCTACLGLCPTGALRGHTARCLSALTQKKGQLTPEESEDIHDHPLVWGCDTCQTVCPYNRAVIDAGRDTPIRYFREKRLLHLDISTLDAMSDSEFSTRAYAWRGRDTIRRNLLLHDETERREI